MPRAVHIIGGGLAGLAAAVRLVASSASVTLHEATSVPGGRCRSYHDHATGLVIDNGNHLLLTGNHAAFAYARAIGSESLLVGPDKAEFPFFDLATRQGWTLRLNDGRFPWWIFDADRRVPDTHPLDYLRLARLLLAPDRPLAEVIDCAGPLYDRLLAPLLTAALNTDPRVASAALAGAIVRETLARGGEACRPRIAREGLGTAFVEPALAYLAKAGATIRLGHELRALRRDGPSVTELDFGADCVALGTQDAVIMAAPAFAAVTLVPGITAPTEFRAILNTHFRADAPPSLPALTGVLNGISEWVFAFPGRISVTTSNADRFMNEPRASLADAIWREVCAVTGLSGERPAWQIVRERRATFAATPEENAKRPGAQTAWRNLFLAGDWTATGLPATIEGAIRSGNRAADLALAL
ncbi:MAG: hydroxysqualene dehydroxylase HpnE [Rhodoplanes sp.]